MNSEKRKNKDQIKVILAIDKAITIFGNITGNKYVFKRKDDALWLNKQDALTIKNKDPFLIIYG